MKNLYSDFSNRRGEVIEGGVHVGQFSIEWGANGRWCSYQPVLNKKGVLIEGVCISTNFQ